MHWQRGPTLYQWKEGCDSFWVYSFGLWKMLYVTSFVKIAHCAFYVLEISFPLLISTTILIQGPLKIWKEYSIAFYEIATWGTPGPPFGWIFWTKTLKDLKKFTSRSWGVIRARFFCFKFPLNLLRLITHQRNWQFRKQSNFEKLQFLNDNIDKNTNFAKLPSAKWLFSFAQL